MAFTVCAARSDSPLLRGYRWLDVTSVIENSDKERENFGDLYWGTLSEMKTSGNPKREKIDLIASIGVWQVYCPIEVIRHELITRL